MTLNRRDFVRISALGTAGLSTASCWPFSQPQARSLPIRIKGLCLVERSGSSVKVHLVDGSKVMMGTHEPMLSVSKSLIDSARTIAPSTPDPEASDRLLFDLSGKTLTLDTGDNSAPDLKVDEAPIDSIIPTEDQQWASVKFAADLRTLCGASRITDTTKFYGGLVLDHGMLQSTKPASQLGQTTVWTFTRQMSDGASQQVARQAMSDTLLCTVPVSKSSAIFTIGTQALVLNAGAAGDVLLRNLPPLGTPGVCKTTNPCVDHLEAFYDLVDHQFKPIATPSSKAVLAAGVEPNYCPPGSI